MLSEYSSISSSQLKKKRKKQENGGGAFLTLADVRRYWFLFFERSFQLASIQFKRECDFVNVCVILLSYFQVISLLIIYESNLGQSILTQAIAFTSRPSAALWFVDAYASSYLSQTLFLVSLFLTFIVVCTIVLPKYARGSSSSQLQLDMLGIFNYVCSLFNAYFFVICIELGLYPIVESALISSYFEIVMGAYICLLTCVISVYCLLFTERSARVFEVGLSRLYKSKMYNVTLVTKLFLVLLSSFSEDNPNQTFMIGVGALFGVCSGIDLVKNFPFSDLKKIQASAAGVSLLFIGIAAVLFDFESERTFTLVAAVIPISVGLSLAIVTKMFYSRIFYGIVRNSLLKEIDLFELESPFFVHQVAFLMRNRMTIMRSPSTKLILLSACIAHVKACTNSSCLCSKRETMIGVQEGRFEVSMHLLEYLLLAESERFLNFGLSEDYEIGGNKLQSFFVILNFMISFRKNIFCLQRVIELHSPTDVTLKTRGALSYGIWFKAGLTVQLKVIQKSMDDCFLEDLGEQRAVYNTAKACVLYFQVEEVKKINLQEVLSIVKSKIKALKQIKNHVKDFLKLKKVNEKFQRKVGNCEKSLQAFYSKVPTRDNQAILCFFLSEIKSDLKAASDLLLVRQFSNQVDMNLLMGSNTIMQIFSGTVHSVRAGFSQKKGGQLLWSSAGFPKLLGYSAQEFNYFQKLNDILPHIHSFYHDELVGLFLQAGDGLKAFSKLRQGYLRHSRGYVLPVQMFININFLDQSQVGFFAFVQKNTQNNQEYILLDEEGCFETTSLGILEKTGIHRYPFDSTLGRLNANLLIENLQDVIPLMNSDENMSIAEYLDISFQIPTPKYFQETEQMQSSTKLSQMSMSRKVNQHRIVNKLQSVRYLNNVKKSLAIRRNGSTILQKNTTEFKIDYQIQKISHSLPSKDVRFYIIVVKRMSEVANDADSMIPSMQILQGGSMAAIGKTKKKVSITDDSKDSSKKVKGKIRKTSFFSKIQRGGNNDTNNDEGESEQENLDSFTPAISSARKFRDLIAQKKLGVLDGKGMNPDNQPPSVARTYLRKITNLLKQDSIGIIKNKQTTNAVYRKSTLVMDSPPKKFIAVSEKEKGSENLLKPLDTTTARGLENNHSFIEEEVNIKEDPATGRRNKVNRDKYMRPSDTQIANELSMNRLPDSSFRYLLQGDDQQKHEELNQSHRNSQLRIPLIEQQNQSNSGLLSSTSSPKKKLGIRSATQQTEAHGQIQGISSGQYLNLFKPNNQDQIIRSDKNHSSLVQLNIHQRFKNSSIIASLTGVGKEDIVQDEKKHEEESKGDKRLTRSLSVQLEMLECMWTERMRSKLGGKMPNTNVFGDIIKDKDKKEKENQPIVVDSDGDDVEIMDTKGSDATRRSMRSMMSLRSCRSMKRKPGEAMKMSYRNVNQFVKLVRETSAAATAGAASKSQRDISSGISPSRTRKSMRYPEQASLGIFSEFPAAGQEKLKDDDSDQKEKTIDSFSSHNQRKNLNETGFSLFKNDRITHDSNGEGILAKSKQNQQTNAAKTNQRDRVEEQSVASSVQKSMFVNKYDNFTKYLSNNEPSAIKRLRFAKILEFLVVSAVTTISIILVFSRFTSLKTNMNIMQIRTDTMLPISNVLRMVNQQATNDRLLSSNAITTSKWSEQLAVLNTLIANNAASYAQKLRENIAVSDSSDVYTSNTMNMRDFLVELDSESTLNIEETYLLHASILMKKVLFVLSQNIYQDSMKTTVSAPISFDATHLSFARNNFSDLCELLQRISESTSALVVKTIDSIESSLFTQFIIVVLAYIVTQSIQVYYYHEYTKLLQHVLRLFETTTQLHLDSEITRLELIYSLTEGDSNSRVFLYDFDLHTKESSLRRDAKQIEALLQVQQTHHHHSLSSRAEKSSKKKKNQSNTTTTMNLQKNNFRIENNQMSYSGFAITAAFLSSPLIVFFCVACVLISTYNNSFASVVASYKIFHDASSFLQTISVMRANIVDFVPAASQTRESTNALMQIFLQTLDEAETMNADYLRVNIQNLGSSVLQESVHAQLFQNICEDNSSSSSVIFSRLNAGNSSTLNGALQDSCRNSRGGVLELGVQNYFASYLAETNTLLDLEFKNSFVFEDSSWDESNIQVIAAQALVNCARDILEDLTSQASFYQNGLVILASLLLLVTFVMNVHALYWQDAQFLLEFRNAKNIIFLLPSVTLLTDETFFKQINYLIKNLQRN